jgi:hypothetical protein
MKLIKTSTIRISIWYGSIFSADRTTGPAASEETAEALSFHDNLNNDS